MDVRSWGGILAALLMAAPVMAPAAPAKGVTLTVAANGNDRWSGRLAAPNATKTDGPLATLARARDLLRAQRVAGGLQGPVTVQVRGGLYPISETIVFGPQDSGTAEAPLTFAAYPGEKPVFSGGRRIRGLTATPDGLWRARVAGPRFEQLYVNGKRAVLARTPNRGYLYADGTIATGVDPATGKQTALGDRAFLARERDLAPLLRLPPERLRAVIVSAYHSWEISRHRVAAVDPKRRILFLTGKYPPKFGHYVTQERYLLENYREALDAPGEWILEEDGTLLYKPRPGETLATAEVVVPGPEVLLRLAGEGPERMVAHLNFRGLAFRYAGYVMPSEGHWSPQAACNVGAAIEADYARAVSFEGCEVEHTGTYGMWFRDGCHECVVQRCFLGDLGAGGIRLGQTSRLPKAEEVTRRIRVDNCIIRGGGRVWPDAVGILIGHSGDNQVTHNDLSLLAYSGISAGWRWGYGEVPSKGNLIAHNRIHHLGWDVLADMGGIYTLGESPGTVLRHNVIHDIDGDGESSMHGIYNDNSTTDMVIENNLVYRVRDGGYKLGSGRNNVVRNNIFVADPRHRSKYGQFLFCMYYPAETHRAATLERNLFYGSGGILFSLPEFGARLELRSNLYWEPTGKPLEFAGKSFEAWRALGYDAGSVIADPGFRDPARDDYRLRPDSPALALGFVPFDPGEAGVYGDPAWVARAAGVSLPPWQGFPPPPPAEFADDFEETPVGDPPTRARTLVEGKGDVLAVTEETAASGKRSLQVTDAPGLKHAFNPHFWYSPAHHSGVSTLSLDLRLDAGAELTLEWREYPGKPYYWVGPRAVFRNGKLVVADRPPLDLPVGTWFHVEMTAGFGPDRDGTWNLVVTFPGGEVKRFQDLPFATPETRAVTWIGFISSGNQASTYYVDNVRLTNSKAGES